MCTIEQWQAVFLSRLVSFVFIDVIISPEGEERSPRAFAASGFLLDVGDEHYFVTVGHLLRDIETELPGLGRRIARSAFMNSWASESPSNSPHFFDYAALPKFQQDDDAEGIDLGMIRLPNDLYRALRDSGTTPILPIQLQRPLDRPVVQHWIAGVPSCLAQDDVTRWFDQNSASIELEPFCFRVERLEGIAGGFTRTVRDRFYASIPAEVNLGDVDGVSGAAVFALTRNDQSEHDLWVEAVQAQWRPLPRTIAGTLFPLNIDILERGRAACAGA